MDNGNKVISLKSWIEKDNKEEDMIEFENGKCLINATIFYIGTTFGLERIIKMFPKEKWMSAIDKVYKK